MTDDLQVILAAYVEGSSIVKIKIYDTMGRTVFSTDPAQIGQVKAAHGPLLQALGGFVGSEYSSGKMVKSFGRTLTDRDVVASYIPIPGGDGNIEAVFEVYNDVTGMMAGIETVQFRLFGAALACLWILYGCLVLFVRRAQRTKVQQIREISSKQRDLKRANAALESEVLERKDAQKALVELNDTLEEKVAERTELLQQREAALFESKQRFQDFATASSDFYWEMDAALRYSYFSSRFREITGIAPSDMLGMAFEECSLTGIDPEQRARHLNDLENHRSFRNFVYSQRQTDGRLVWLSSSGIAHFDEHGVFKGYRGIGNDITEQVVAEQRAERARMDAVDASQAKSDFLANMSHELRTPLNAIIGYTELLQEEAEERNESALLMDLVKVRKASTHLLDLINNVLDLSKIEAKKTSVTLEQIDLNELISEVADTVEPLVAENQNSFRTEVRTDIRYLITDGLMLRQTLVNLLGNAAKFTDSGCVCLFVEQDNEDALAFVVRDTGVGMSDMQIKEIFQPFTQGDDTIGKTYGGTGLGLTLCKQYVELLNGTIKVESELGAGSLFTVRLPIHQVDISGATAMTA